MKSTNKVGLLLAAALSLSSACATSGPEEPARANTRTGIRASLFADVSTTDPQYDAIRYVTANHIMDVDANGRFLPDQAVSRGEILCILLRAAGRSNGTLATPNPFGDFDINHRFANCVRRAAHLRVVHGYTDGALQGTFQIDRTVSLIEALKMLLLSNGIDIDNLPRGHSFRDVPTGSWYEGLGLYAWCHHLADQLADGSMGRDLPLDRARVARLLYNFFTDRNRHNTSVCASRVPANQ